MALCLAACTTSPPLAQSIPQAADTAAASVADVTTAGWRSHHPIDPSRSSVGEVTWSTAALDVLTPQERLRLEHTPRGDLEAGLRDLPAQTRGRRVRLNVTVMSIETVSPTLNVASALLLFVPLDRGGATLELIAIDKSDGASVAALRWSAMAPITQFRAQFERIGPAGFVLGDAARSFVRLLGNEHAGPADDEEGGLQ